MTKYKNREKLKSRENFNSIEIQCNQRRVTKFIDKFIDKFFYNSEFCLLVSSGFFLFSLLMSFLLYNNILYGFIINISIEFLLATLFIIDKKIISLDSLKRSKKFKIVKFENKFIDESNNIYVYDPVNIEFRKVSLKNVDLGKDNFIIFKGYRNKRFKCKLNKDNLKSQIALAKL